MSGVRADAKYVPSEDIVAREIEGELVIVPLAAGIGDLEDELYTLNESGRAIWEHLDGTTSLVQIALTLSEEFDAPAEEIEKDVCGLVEELLKRGIVVETITG
jgi:hypothetical protein